MFYSILVALKSKNNMKHKANEEYNLKEQQLKSSHEEALEKNVLKIKQVTKQKKNLKLQLMEKNVKLML